MCLIFVVSYQMFCPNLVLNEKAKGKQKAAVTSEDRKTSSPATLALWLAF